MTEDGTTLPPLEAFNLDQPKLAEYVSDQQLSPNGLYPGNHSSPGVGEELLPNIDNNNIGGGMGYNSLSLSPDLHVQNYHQDQKPLMGSGYYDNHFPNMYSQQLQEMEPVRDLYKNGIAEKAGYVDMLNSSSEGIVIKKEKMDFDGHFGGMLQSEVSPDMPYPPNTCVADWNYYHNNNSTAPSYMQPMHSYPQNMHYQTSNMPNNLNHNPPNIGFSNLDLHNQAKKITAGILESNWSSESLYKSQVYNSMANDTMASGVVRKRKQPVNDSGPSRVRKRKTSSNSNLGGHSKTVASILLSEQNQPVYIGKGKPQNGKIDPSLLDSSARDEFVTTLMNNLRTTVQFESFCLSFPRNEKEESAFKHKVGVTADLVSSVDEMGVCSKAFPEVYTRLAEKNVLTFKQALSKTEKKKDKKTENDSSIKAVLNCTAEMVEEQMPHSMLWAARLNSELLTANWEGQFVASVNPMDATLYLSIFQFSPAFSPEGVKSLHQARMTKDLAQEIFDNMQAFEVSRQVRVDVDLHSVRQMYLHAPNGEEDEAVLVLEFDKDPEFYQRWLHTSAEDKNKWQKRSNFFSEKRSSVGVSEYLYLGGLLSELNELVALMFASIPNLKDVYQLGLYSEFKTPDNDLDQNDSTARPAVSSSTDIKIRKTKITVQNLRNSDIPFQKLRQEVVETLVHFKIIDSYELETYFGLDSITPEMCNESLDISFDDGISECFKDYVNYKCESARELTQLLDMAVMARRFGFTESDYHSDRLGDQDIDLMTVAELIRTKCSDTVYYSFCRKEVGQLGHDRHCSKCHQCTTWKYWHCKNCNKCSEGSRICQYCGHSCDDPGKVVIKPLSVYKSELEKGTVSMDIKPDWNKSLNQSETDILKLAPLDVTYHVADNGSLEYNTHNAMKDQLGLLDPVGFMFGQTAASRKHRRNKVRRQISKAELDGSGLVQPDTSEEAGPSQTKTSCNIQ